ncbi:MAG TPA: sugar phosphate nucleotidyltransferase, partial [Bryobacteraceae bacterium]|nr:sugar phosphate nucleotidyltransferase [Bryobacteraceae bacterium]
MKTPRGQVGLEDHCWGVILAGGDGTRLLSLTRKIHGEDRPKQFAAVFGSETLLEQTRKRVASLIPNSRITYTLTRAHERFYQAQLASVPHWAKFEQPENRGTAHGVLFSLLRLKRLEPRAIVGFFPSDHHIANREAFRHEIGVAYEEAKAQRDRVVLVGIEPTSPETSYGWIERGEKSGRGHAVKRFCEKPDPITAASLMRAGCLWNGFIMVGYADAFLALFEAALPELLNAFRAAESVSGKPEGHAAVEDLYRRTAAA